MRSDPRVSDPILPGSTSGDPVLKSAGSLPFPIPFASTRARGQRRSGAEHGSGRAGLGIVRAGLGGTELGGAELNDGGGAKLSGDGAWLDDGGAARGSAGGAQRTGRRMVHWNSPTVFSSPSSI
jgi:hypothetical protein